MLSTSIIKVWHNLREYIYSVFKCLTLNSLIMKTLLVQIQGSILQSMGPFKLPMILISILVLVLIVMLIIDTFVNKEVNAERRKRGMSALLVLGSMNAAVGMLGQIMGIWFALAAIIEAADVNPEIIMVGLQSTFATTFYGFITFFVAIIAWLILNYIPGFKPKA